MEKLQKTIKKLRKGGYKIKLIKIDNLNSYNVIAKKLSKMVILNINIFNDDFFKQQVIINKIVYNNNNIIYKDSKIIMHS